MLKIMHIVGSRPNFMKLVPVMNAFSQHNSSFVQALVHTGQHYDHNMSRIFFEDLDIPDPDVNLRVGPGSPISQTAEIMLRLEPVFKDYRPDWIFVYGDVNSTLASSLAAMKSGIRIAHVEAGLRSFDKSMPEEWNRILTDHIAEILFTPSEDADINLCNEGVPAAKIKRIGNVMIDTLEMLLAKSIRKFPALKERFEIQGQYMLVTLHRPSNVDFLPRLKEILSAIRSLSSSMKIIFPVHPRTSKQLEDVGSFPFDSNIVLCEPLGYLDFLSLESNARLVMTDSGGVQEETSYLGVPCITLRSNTERPITTSLGTNKIVPGGHEEILQAANECLALGATRRPAIPLWDGHASDRIVKVFQDCL